MNSKQSELTIFQGAPSIHIDNNQHIREEEEIIEDQKRRDAELHDELVKEFGNISEYEDDDVSETEYSTHFSFRRNSKNKHDANDHKDFPLRDDFMILNNKIDAKDREIEKLSELLNIERKKHKTIIDEYEKRLTIFESEKERALMSRDQAQENLVESKGKMIEIKDINEKLMSKIKLLQSENEQLVGEMESTKLMLSDVQTKYNMVEKNVLFNAECNTDLIIKQTQERHNAQIAMMQQQIDNFKKRYDELEHNYKHLDIRYKELQKSRETMLIEKTEIINQLSKNLEESQRQCQDLLQQPQLINENKRLQIAIEAIENQKIEMSQTINKLQKTIQEQKSEIETMDSIMNDCSKNNQSFAEMSNFINREPLKNVNSSTPVTTETKLTKVMDELIKSQNNIRNKREEIKILEKQLKEKDDEIENMRNDENKLLIELNQYKDEVLKLQSKISLMQKEFTNQNANDKEEINNLKKEVDMKTVECENIRCQIDSLKLIEVETHRKLESKDEQLRNTIQEMYDLRKKIQEFNNFENQKCEKCENYAIQIEKLELSYNETQNLNANYLNELNSLKAELTNAQQSLQALQDQINLQNSRDKEIEKLQEKAKEFENFMRNTNKESSESGKSLNDSQNNEISNSQSEIENNEKKLNTETKIRDEMARIFANQIKTLEKRFVDESKKMQSQIVSLMSELNEKTADLDVASEQLELLKYTIVQERKDFQEHLKQKDESFKEKVQKYQKHISDLNEQLELIDGERILIENLKKQIEDERALLNQKELDTASKLKSLQHESTKIIEELNEKYKKAKKTAANYKQYSEDKEKHYRSECERIKAGYAEAIEKAQIQFQKTIKENEEIYQQKLKRIEQEYKFKIEVLKEMLDKKSQNL
ncbi:hypothetical protein PVAND_011774 [Polypedilum vanderplanki]|uniref:Uncharacterized protein n=1 Tax=Polypedilum vanderplanki TaxID=319348 RepID=A0A9J6CKE3_POLVA|nr:hypothetical protein PVAND_011774 [Polypedilum vanderplanki]